MSISLKSLRQYNATDLFRIALYKAGYKIQLSFERLLLATSLIKWPKIDVPNIIRHTTNEQPRLLDIYRRIDSMQSTAANAERILNGEIELFSKWYNFDYRQDWLKDLVTGNYWDCDIYFANAPTRQNGFSDVKLVLEVNKFNHLVIVASAYYQTNDSRYFDFIIDSLNGWIKCVKYERSVTNRIIMDAAFRIINLINISLLCSNHAEYLQRLHPLIFSIIKGYDRQIDKFSTPRWFKTGNGANHVIGEMVGSLIAQYWYEEFCCIKADNKRMRCEYNWLYETLDKLVSKEGIYLEQSSNYSRLVCEFLIALDAFERFANVETKTRKYLIPLCEYVLNLVDKNSNLPNFGDNDGASVLTSFKENIDDISPIKKYYHEVLNQVYSPNNNHNYSKEGQFIWKSYDKTQISLFIRCGEFCHFREGAAAHAHCDLLSILLSVKGLPLFVDKGCYLYNSERTLRYADVSTSAHNTVWFDGIEQAVFDGKGYYKYPSVKLLSNNNELNIFSGEVSYDSVCHQRTIKYIDHKILIVDKLQSQVCRDLGIRYRLYKGLFPQLGADNRISIINENGELFATVQLSNVNISIEKDYYSPSYAVREESYSIIGRGRIDKCLELVTEITF